MLRLCCVLGLLCGAEIPQAIGDTLRLADGAQISGSLLAEKADQVVVDVGYTVLVVPRSAIVEIERATSGGAETSEDASAETIQAENGDSLFSSGVVDARERNVTELVRQLGEAVVQVKTPSGLGSGFFLNPEGFLVTNFHVIEGETQISVEVYHQQAGQLERRTYRKVRIIALNKFADLALLRIEDEHVSAFAAAPLAQADQLAVGDRVFAIGSPLGLERTVTEGIVSTKTRQVEGGLYLQTTTQINPGNSGGPLFSLRGEVVGVTNMKLRFAEGLGFAIPVGTVRHFLEHRDAYAYDQDNPSNPYRYLPPPRRVKSDGVSEKPEG
jgi:serine protease Do